MCGTLYKIEIKRAGEIFWPDLSLKISLMCSYGGMI